MANPAIVVVNAAALTGVETTKSIVSTRGTSTSFHYVIRFSGTPAGTLKLEVNNVPQETYTKDVTAAGSESANTTNWVQQDLSPDATVAITTAVDHTISFRPRGVRYRLSYTNSASTGTLNAWLTTG